MGTENLENVLGISSESEQQNNEKSIITFG